MAIISLPYVFTVGQTIIASQHNSNFQTIYNDYNGNIIDANIASNAAIEYTKLSLNNSIKNSDLISTFNSSSGFGVVPSGGIIMWSGSIASIPTGWYLCNGSNGTPNLTSQFIIGASGTGPYTVGASGGSTTITIGNLPSFNLTVPYLSAGGSTPGIENATGTLSNSQNTSSIGSGTPYLQPYYALAFIQKS